MSLRRLGRSYVPSEVADVILNFVRNVKSRFPDAEVYLFGSYAKGVWLDDSDIDLIVVSTGFKGMSMEERARVLRLMADRRYPFQILAYTPEEFKEVLRRSVVLQDAAKYWIKLT